MARDARFRSQAEIDLFVATFRRTGFRPGIAWYLNDAADSAFAEEAWDFGRLSLPVLFLDGEYDPVDGTLKSRLAEPMRLVCSNLTQAWLASGYHLMWIRSRTYVPSFRTNSLRCYTICLACFC